jgi:hypothetical protein
MGVRLGSAAVSRQDRSPGVMPIRALLDTSALVPAAQREDLQALAQAGLYIGIWSPWVIAELNRVLTWKWIRASHGDLSRTNEKACSRAAKRMMALLFTTFVLVHPEPPYPPAWESLTDVWDQPIWAAAKLGGADHVVSENTRHVPPKGPDGRHRHEGIVYLTGQAFIDQLSGTRA